ncbi:hypothetical protein LTR56_015879 [Elasticomyces elasticus]|nr:hypothetical protein LTR56_015879 [Elasticomyces elasticus]KAK3640041.1 hypothetical protein LTR22_017199 [Elasticomyces elasticus]KAK5754996.1 hypothetical protein LTS12_014912 [Elasticomyces elasticus]
MSDNGPGEDDDKRTYKLARIHNQRRNRALRKEYLNELEAKVRRCRQTEAKASRELQTAARKVSEENQQLRQLLRQQGLSDIEIEGYLPRPESSQYPDATAIALESMIEQRKPWERDSGCGNGRNTSIARQRDIPVMVMPQHLMTPCAVSLASPQSLSSSALHTPNIYRLATSQPHIQTQPYELNSSLLLADMDNGMNYDDAFSWT